jgi:hypothetical protein
MHQFPVHNKTHRYYIYFTPCHYYVQQQWLSKQRDGIAEMILDKIWTLIPIHFNYTNKH